MGNTISNDDTSDDEYSDEDSDEYHDENIIKSKNVNRKSDLTEDNNTPDNIKDTKLLKQKHEDWQLLSNKLIKCLPDELDNSDVDNKTNYHLINILHNIFLLKDLKKLKKLNINNYKINKDKDKDNSYQSLLINMYNTIINSEIIDDILNDFPFEYQEYNIDDKFNNFEDMNFLNPFLSILSFYKNKEYSKDFLLYNLIEDSEQNNDNIRGFTIKDTLNCINKNGIILHNENYNYEPSYSDFKNAKLRNKLSFLKVKQNLNDLKDLINNNIPIIFCISIYKIDDNKIVLDKKKQNIIPMIITGYNDNRKEFIVRNDKSYYVDYSYILNKKICRDFWIMKLN